MGLLWLALIPLLLGPIIGVLTNFINADVSKEYFEIVMGWNLDYVSISTLAMLQGAFEGFIYGAIFSLVFTVYVARTNRAVLGKKFFRSIFIRVVVIVIICWLLGGIVGVMVLKNFPEVGPNFNNVLTFGETYLRERFGWVAGSIWGGMIGGVLALAWTIYKTSREGKKLKTP